MDNGESVTGYLAEEAPICDTIPGVANGVAARLTCVNGTLVSSNGDDPLDYISPTCENTSCVQYRQGPGDPFYEVVPNGESIDAWSQLYAINCDLRQATMTCNSGYFIGGSSQFYPYYDCDLTGSEIVYMDDQVGIDLAIVSITLDGIQESVPLGASPRINVVVANR